MNEAGDENGLARAAEPGDGQPHRRGAGKLAEIADQTLRRLREDGRQPAQVHHGCHGFTCIAPETLGSDMGSDAHLRKCRTWTPARSAAYAVTCSTAASSNRSSLPRLSRP